MTEDRYPEALVEEGELELALCLNYLKREGYIPAFIPETALHVPGLGRMQALILHQRGGGWVADLLLADVAPDKPDVLGTPDSVCVGDKDTARKQGWQLVGTIVLNNMRHRPPQPKARRARRKFARTLH